MEHIATPWGFDAATPTLKAFGQEWVYRGENRTTQMVDLLKGARAHVDLAISVNEANRFAADADFMSVLDETAKEGIPVIIALDKNESTRALSEQVDSALLDLARNYPVSFMILECHKKLAMHFAVIDGVGVMMEEPGHPAEDLPTTVFLQSSAKVGQALYRLFSQIPTSEHTTELS